MGLIVIFLICCLSSLSYDSGSTNNNENDIAMYNMAVNNMAMNNMIMNNNIEFEPEENMLFSFSTDSINKSPKFKFY